MIDIGNVATPSPEQFMFALRSMRNPLNSWDKQDSYVDDGGLVLGDEDYKLAMKLARNGSEHRKYLRSLPVMMDITAPLYWWKEFDTYKIGTVSNSCSTMHKIQAKEFTIDDFSHEHLLSDEPIPTRFYSAEGMMEATVENLNMFRKLYLETKDKCYWWQMIQLLPSSYNQKRTVLLRCCGICITQGKTISWMNGISFVLGLKPCHFQN